MEWKKAAGWLAWRGGGIRRRLLGIGLLFLGVALLANTVAGTLYTAWQIRKAAARLQIEVGSKVAHQIADLIERKKERLTDLAVSLSLHESRSEGQRLLVLLLLKNDQAFTGLAVLDERGMEVVKVSERRVYLARELSDQSRQDYFRRALSGEIYVSPVYTTDKAEPYVTMAVPIHVGPARVTGVLAADVNLTFLWQIIGAARFSDAGSAWLVDHQGNLIAHQDPSLVLKRTNLKNHFKVREFLRNPAGTDRDPAAEGVGITGERVLSTYAPVGNLGWAVVLTEPLNIALTDVKKMLRCAVLLLAIGLAVGSIVIIWASNKITGPIRELHRGVEVIGGGNLDYRVEIKSGDEIEELSHEFNEMAGELKNFYATLEQRVEQRTREVAALYEVTTAVNQSLDLETSLQAVIAKITEIFRFEATRIFLFDRPRERLERRASFEASLERWLGPAEFKRGEGIVGRVAESGAPVIFEDIETDPRYQALSASRATRGAQRRFFAVFPIKTPSRIFGVMTFNGAAPRSLTGDERRLLTSMCEQLGVAVEKANLFEAVQIRSQHLAVLNTIGEAVSHSLDLDVVLKAAVEKIAATLGFDACWIYILEPSAEELQLKAYNGLSAEMAQEMARRKLTAGVSSVVFQTGERLVFEDVRADEGYSKVSATGRARALGFVTAAGFPIRAKDKVIGTLHVVSRVKRHFAAEELQLIESIAHEVGVAVENARLFAEVNEKTSALAEANQELQEATQAKSEFIAAMSHELRTPLNIIIGNSDLTRDGFFGAVNGEQKDALQKVSRNARVLLKMINDVLALSRLEAKKMSLDIDTVEVEEVIAHARTHVEQINRDNHLEVLWDIDRAIPPLVTDPLKLEEILQNLIGNAFKFTPTGRVEVRVRNLRAADRVEFSVADTGIGIESENLAKIFNEFEQIEEAHTGKFNGVGLGLSIVGKYLELMQGDIRVESKPGEGSVFTFSLPRSLSPSH